MKESNAIKQCHWRQEPNDLRITCDSVFLGCLHTPEDVKRVVSYRSIERCRHVQTARW